MNKCLPCLIVLTFFGLWSSLLAQDPPEAVTRARIDELVGGLSDSKFSVRKQSEEQLVRMGKPAVEHLQRLIEDADQETRVRARRVLRRMMLTLTMTGAVSESGLADVTSVAISRSGRGAYTAAYSGGAVSFYSRDPESGKLTHVQTISDLDTMNGAVSLRLSDDQRYAVSPCFRSRTLVLFRIDPQTGALDRSHVVDRIGKNGRTKLAWSIEALFSHDSKFVYAIDPNYENSGALIVMKVADGKLEWVETNTGKDGCFRGARSLAIRPGGKTLFVAADRASALTVVELDKETGMTEVRSVHTDGTSGIQGLGGAFAVACSPDGKFVYSSSGRFQGDDSVGVFKVQDDGSLAVVQELENGRDGLDGFQGGNEILVTPDGKYVYAAATRSSMVAGFRRDAETGKLSVLDTESIDLNEPGSLGPAGLGISPDGRFLYVAAESPGKIIVFRRRTLESLTGD